MNYFAEVYFYNALVGLGGTASMSDFPVVYGDSQRWYFNRWTEIKADVKRFVTKRQRWNKKQIDQDETKTEQLESVLLIWFSFRAVGDLSGIYTKVNRHWFLPLAEQIYKIINFIFIFIIRMVQLTV